LFIKVDNISQKLIIDVRNLTMDYEI